jgi:hypothetical protein
LTGQVEEKGRVATTQDDLLYRRLPVLFFRLIPSIRTGLGGLSRERRRAEWF